MKVTENDKSNSNKKRFENFFFLRLTILVVITQVNATHEGWDLNMNLDLIEFENWMFGAFHFEIYI